MPSKLVDTWLDAVGGWGSCKIVVDGSGGVMRVGAVRHWRWIDGPVGDEGGSDEQGSG